jgi:hypothetical protein
MSETIALILGITSGFALTGFHQSAANMIATSFIVDASLAPVTAIVAYQHGRSALRWAIAGFIFGAWALATALILVRVQVARRPDDFPPGPHAA